MIDMVRGFEKVVVKSKLCQARKVLVITKDIGLPGSKDKSLEKTSKAKVSIVLPQLKYSGSNAISLNKPKLGLGASIEDRVLNRKRC